MTASGRNGVSDRFQPALLDRLTDDQPGERSEGEAARGLSLTRLREVILRDLSWLLNTSHLESTIDLTPYPEVAASTLNYGVRMRTGHEIGGLNPTILHREMLQSLRRFEPRLLPESLEITVFEDRQNGMFQFKIEADLWAHPQPLHMLMRTEAGEAAGSIKVVELRGEAG